MKSIKARNRQEGRLLESADTIGSTMAKRPRNGLRFADGHAGNTATSRSPDARNDRAAGEQSPRDGARDSSRAHRGGHAQSERFYRPDGERRVELRGWNPVPAQEQTHAAPRQAARERRVRTRKGFTTRTPKWKKRHEEIFFVPVRLWS